MHSCMHIHLCVMAYLWNIIFMICTLTGPHAQADVYCKFMHKLVFTYVYMDNKMYTLKYTF